MGTIEAIEIQRIAGLFPELKIRLRSFHRLGLEFAPKGQTKTSMNRTARPLSRVFLSWTPPAFLWAIQVQYVKPESALNPESPQHACIPIVYRCVLGSVRYLFWKTLVYLWGIQVENT
eukprot:COSAG05_NODE_2850_length_2573_cov_2.078011_3_plen_118_part_00